MSDENSEDKQGVKDSLKDWGFDVEQFEARAKQSMENAKGDLSEITGTLRETLHRAKEVVVDLQKSGVAPVAAELRSGFERAWSEIEAAFANARQKAREARQKSEEPAPEPVEPVNPMPPDDPSI